ncbi:CsbD family protein [Gluconobacter aidae]|uniref:CsbD family protein n=1 Tax=Gluconobacter aidae TaxID=2662454 RepID=A0A7X1SNR0_9PROT|nr:CsbD family protein [Gluconobacter aidae]MQR97912.1 CsbD family protein [Gluconobacter aidae]
MSSMEDRIKGVANQVTGKIKEEVGHVTNDKKLEAEGVAQNLKGKVQKTAGDAKDAVKSGIDKL